MSGVALAPVLAFAIVVCPKAMYVAGASVRVQAAVQAPSPLPDSSGRSVIAFRERPTSGDGWTPWTHLFAWRLCHADENSFYRAISNCSTLHTLFKVRSPDAASWGTLATSRTE